MEECLSDMKKILDNNGQHFFLICGTLLGQQRENDFISYDSDIDLGIMWHKYDANIKNKIIESNKFELFHELGNIKDSKELTFIHNNGTHIDIFLFYPINENKRDYYFYCASFYGLCDLKKEGHCRFAYHIRGFKKIKFKNRIYNIPSNPHEFLTEAYGDWMTPKNYTYNEGLEGEYKNLI